MTWEQAGQILGPELAARADATTWPPLTDEQLDTVADALRPYTRPYARAGEHTPAA